MRSRKGFRRLGAGALWVVRIAATVGASAQQLRGESKQLDVVIENSGYRKAGS